MHEIARKEEVESKSGGFIDVRCAHKFPCLDPKLLVKADEALPSLQSVQMASSNIIFDVDTLVGLSHLSFANSVYRATDDAMEFFHRTKDKLNVVVIAGKPV